MLISIYRNIATHIGVFLSVFSCCTQSGDMPKEDLAKCGSKRNRKAENLKNPTSWPLSTRTYYPNMAIFYEES